MNFNIPRVGEKYRLLEDFTFTLYPESRNQSLIDYFEFPKYASIRGNYTQEEINRYQGPQALPRRFGYFFVEEEAFEQLGDHESHIYHGASIHVPEPSDWERTISMPGVNATLPCTLPQGSYLLVHRVYVRGSGGIDPSDYDSVTFRFSETPNIGKSFGGSKSQPRFWVKLDEVNNMNVEKIVDEQEQS
jgi:hypothetical protein